MGERGEVGGVAAEPPGHRVGDLGGVERAHERQVAAGGVGEPGDEALGIVGGGRAHGVHGARRAERDGDVADAEADPERGGHVVATAGPHGDARRQPQLLGRRREQRADGGEGRPHGRQPVEPRAAVASPTTVAISSALYASRPVSNQPVPDASPRSVTCSPHRPKVSQSCGSITRATASNTSG